jgi:cellobiose-specific phosphotransferase system component IIB
MANNDKLLIKLSAYLAEKSRKTLTVNEFDSGYNSLTEQEKQAILNSILTGDDVAKNIIDIKLNGPIIEAAKKQAQQYIDANSIPVDVIADFILKG